MKTKLYPLLLIPSFVCCTSNQNNTAKCPDGDSSDTTASGVETAAAQPSAPAKITIEWSKNADNTGAENVHEAVLSEECSAKFTLSTDAPVGNFKILALELLEANESGEMKFGTEEKYALEGFSEKELLNVCGEMFGTIPNLGLSYEEGEQTKTFAITESGEDGSLILMPINQ